MLGFLASGGEEFNPGPVTRLDCSELLCNKVLLKYKEIEKASDIDIRRGQKECPLTSVSKLFSSVAQSCPTLCDPVNHSTPGLPVHHQLLEFTKTHVHRVSDAIQPSHPLSSPSPPAPNTSQHQSLSNESTLHEVAKVLEFQL